VLAGGRKLLLVIFDTFNFEGGVDQGRQLNRGRFDGQLKVHDQLGPSKRGVFFPFLESDLRVGEEETIKNVRNGLDTLPGGSILILLQKLVQHQVRRRLNFRLSLIKRLLRKRDRLLDALVFLNNSRNFADCILNAGVDLGRSFLGLSVDLWKRIDGVIQLLDYLGAFLLNILDSFVGVPNFRNIVLRFLKKKL
jgi:hypothetical protein